MVKLEIMKKIILTLSIVLFLTQCKKENNIKVKDVTQTDENCNIIGDPNPDQFRLMHLSEMSTFDEGYFYGNSAPTNFITELGKANVSLDDYDQNCPITSNFSYVTCPSPIPNNYNSNSMGQKIETDLDIYYVFKGEVNENGDLVGFGGSNAMFVDDYFYPTWFKNYTAYFIIFTNDGCVYYTKGDVAYEK